MRKLIKKWLNSVKKRWYNFRFRPFQLELERVNYNSFYLKSSIVKDQYKMKYISSYFAPKEDVLRTPNSFIFSYDDLEIMLRSLRNRKYEECLKK